MYPESDGYPYAMDQRRAVSAVILLLWITCAHGLAAEPRQALRTDAAQADRVVELPGAKAEDLDFGLFAGCVLSAAQQTSSVAIWMLWRSLTPPIVSTNPAHDDKCSCIPSAGT